MRCSAGSLIETGKRRRKSGIRFLAYGSKQTDNKERTGDFMGRSRQGIEPRKNFTVRLSAKEHRLLEQKAHACGMNPSRYIRQLISNGGMVDVTLPEQRRDFINQISRIGNNINQIAHRANADGWISEWDVERVIAKMEEVKELMQEVAGRWQ